MSAAGKAPGELPTTHMAHGRQGAPPAHASVLATHLAAAAHLAGRPTKLLDLDAEQLSATGWYSNRRDGSRLDGLSVVGVGAALSRPKFRELGRGAEIVVCDGPPRLGDVSRAAAFASDLVIVALRPGWYDFNTCAKHARVIDVNYSCRSTTTISAGPSHVLTSRPSAPVSATTLG